jgi:4-hydroxy-tetrahydrodipicolinate reductase
MPIRIGLIGASGKMGKRIVTCALQDPDVLLTCGIVSPRSFWIGRDLGTLVHASPIHVLASTKETALTAVIDVLIDFSTINALQENIQLAIDRQIPLVIGTTGLDETSMQEIQKAARQIPILCSPNFSLGMAACVFASKLLAKVLKNQFTPHIQETHHIHKKDKPSGSALALAEAIREGKNSCDISIHSTRAGEIVGEHTVIFYGDHEKVELSHAALSRDSFAKGALTAAKFIYQKKPGLYSLQDLFYEND